MSPARALLYSANASAIALGVRSVAMGPLPFGVAVAAVAAYSGVVLSGVLSPRLAMFADVVNELDPSEVPSVALTFDDGPDRDVTPRLLDALATRSARATFFVIGRKLDADRAPIVRRAAAEGHSIGCHSFGHARLFALQSARAVREDLRRAKEATEQAIGAPVSLFRPPIGHTNPTIARVAEELGMTIVGWSMRALDGLASATPERIVARVARGLHDGAIVCLHDGAERDDFRPTVAATFPPIAAAAQRLGLALVSLHQGLPSIDTASTPR